MVTQRSTHLLILGNTTNQVHHPKLYFSKFKGLLLPEIEDITFHKDNRKQKKDITEYFAPLKHQLHKAQIYPGSSKDDRLGWLFPIITRISVKMNRLDLWKFSMTQNQFFRIVLALGRVKRQIFCDCKIIGKSKSSFKVPIFYISKRKTLTKEILIVRFSFQGNPNYTKTECIH
ncbi:unnamed protein product [Moneuplotes crassus]|uniref:Uncharacterized protein n=1 Tax=Euplotes crassus TaxID=5936 RepID=A0AAD1UNY8_EUPCR|nr:unnamed protein product [Moneuplotes crassus]